MPSPDIPSNMRAVRYAVKGPPAVLHVETIPTPKPGSDEVMIRIEFAGVNPADSHVRSDEHFSLRVPLPAIPGKDGAGQIVAVGADVTTFKVGDRVFVSDHTFRSNGTYAEYHVAKEPEVHHLPDNYTMEEGAANGVPYFTAIRALFHAAKGKAGETLLVHGASGQVGVACVQLAVAHGFIVYGTAGTADGLKRVIDCGAKAAFNHKEANYFDQIKTTIGAKGPDIIIEMIASTNMQRDLELIAKKGRIVVVGGRGMLPINPTLIMAKESIVTGVRLVDATPDDWREMSKILQDGLAKRWVKPVIGKVYPLAEAVKAHQNIEHPTGSQGRILLKL